MPNWCSTDYYVLGSRKEIMDLSKRMERLENRKKSLINNGFGNTWLGNLVNNLGGEGQLQACTGVELQALADFCVKPANAL